MATVAPSGAAASAAEKARQIAAKYSGEGQSFNVKYLGTQEVSSARGDAVIADCLKELRMLFKDVIVHLPKVVITLQLSGITVVDEKSKLETIKVPLNRVSYVCLDPADNSVFSFIIHSEDTISSKGLRLHAFVCHPQIAITFNRSARELFEFMSRIVRAKKKIAQQEVESAGVSQHSPQSQDQLPFSTTQSGVQGLVVPPRSVSKTQSTERLLPAADSSVAAAGLTDEDKKQQAVFDEWKELEKELDDIGQELGISSPAQAPSTSTPASSATTTPAQQAQPEVMTTSGSDPFSGSFFQVSFNSVPPQPAPTATTATTADIAASPPGQGDQDTADQHVFDNPLFNGDSDQNGPFSEGPPATPEGKQLTYASRPRPKGKSLDISAPLSPPATTDTDGGRLKSAREVSLSPNSEEEVKSILTNNDPFTPPSLDAFQSPQSNGSESGFFQPQSFTPNTTSNPGSFFFPHSVLAQDSIQLMNPLYQPYTSNGSITGPFSPLQHLQSPVVMSPPAVLMQQQYTAPPQPPVMLQQSLIPAVQPQYPTDVLMGPLPMGTFNGILSPTNVTSPPVAGSEFPLQNPPEASMMGEKKDSMFADLLTSTSHPIPEKKKKFEPETKKVAGPTLAQLQEKKKKEEEEAFRVSNSSHDDEQIEVTVDWPLSPFDDVLSNESPNNMPELLLASSTPKSATATAADQQAPSNQQRNDLPLAQVLDTDDFDTAFKEAGDQEQNIESAFEMNPAPQPKPLATNDPFAPTGSAVSPTPQTSASPWSTF